MVVLALSGLTAASALAAGVPIVETKPATSIRGTEATLNGTVNGNGATTKHYFEYGTTISYGSKTFESESKTVSQTPNELMPSIPYHFRVVATNSYGTSYGADEVFATPAEKPEVVLEPGGKYTALKIEASSGGARTYVEWATGKSLECTSSEFKGHFINSKELEGKMKWSECFGGDRYECFNEKEVYEGRYIHSWIQSEELKGTLGYVNKAKKEVGIKLKGASSEIWANNVNCLGSKFPLTGSLGGQMSLPVNTKIPTTKAFSIVYTEKADEQVTGELGGQLLWEAGYTKFGIEGSLTAKANKEFEIQA
jgi:hypothetical protein